FGDRAGGGNATELVTPALGEPQRAVDAAGDAIRKRTRRRNLVLRDAPGGRDLADAIPVPLSEPQVPIRPDGDVLEGVPAAPGQRETRHRAAGGDATDPARRREPHRAVRPGDDVLRPAHARWQ